MDEAAKRRFKVRDLVKDRYWRLVDDAPAVEGCDDEFWPPRKTLNDEALERLADEVVDFYEGGGGR